MYVKRRYGFWMTFNWSKKPFIYAFIYSLLVVSIYEILKHFGYQMLTINWQPIGVLGIAVAFYLGFKNNASYDRTWEARKIWGGIVNNSRTFGAALLAFIPDKEHYAVKQELIYRHIAWLTALRYQLRLSRQWEHNERRIKGLYVPTICEQYYTDLEEELLNYISEAEFQEYKGKSNIASLLLAKQSQCLQALRDQELFEDFRHMELHKLISEFYADQGRSERIKNFPFPRQYASVAYWMTLIFSIFIPFGLVDVFNSTEAYAIWLSVPFSAIIIWVFYLMEMIGDYSENPFEGTYNDVPITAISRTIEIDLREMLQETNVPKPIQEVNGYLM